MKDRETPLLPLVPFLRGVVLALALALLLAAVTGLVLFLAPLPESVLDWLAPLLAAISVYAGALLAAKSAGARGLVLGLAVALACLLLFTLLGSLWVAAPHSITFLKNALILTLAGVAGGLTGLAF